MRSPLPEVRAQAAQATGHPQALATLLANGFPTALAYGRLRAGWCGVASQGPGRAHGPVAAPCSGSGARSIIPAAHLPPRSSTNAHHLSRIQTIRLENPTLSALDIFNGPGELRALCRTFDWAATPLGPQETWSPTLRTAAQMVLASGLPNIILWGPELIQIYNDAYAKLIQAKHPAALGHGNREIWPEVWHINGPIYERVFQGETVTLEDALYPLQRAGRTEDVYLTVGFSPIRDASGAVAGVLANMLETTSQVELRGLQHERELLLRHLEVEQGRLEYIFEHAPTYLAVLRGPEHVITLANEAYYQLVGRWNLIGKPASQAIPEAAEQGFVEILDRVLATGEPFVGHEMPILLQRTAGAPPEQRFLDFIYQPLFEADGSCSGVAAHGSDVTEQVLARRDVERSRDQIAQLQELTAALAATSTTEEVARVVVARGVAATGAASGMVAVRSYDNSSEGVILRQMGLADDVPEREHRFSLATPGPAAECLRTGTPFFLESREAVLTRFPEIPGIWERMRTQALATVPLEVAGERIGAMSFTFAQPRAFSHEVRAFFLALGRQCAQALERARLFDAEREARAEAEAANHAKSDFLTTMSHELRTPLNAIAGYVDLLELGIHGPVSAAQRDALARIQASQQHLLGLINDVLDYAKIETGNMRFQLGAVSVAHALDEVEALIVPQVSEKSLSLGIDRCDAALAVYADADRLRQILLNVVSNAVKFTGSGGRIEVRCALREILDDAEPSSEPGRACVVEIAVRDTGVGIPAEKLAAIFEPFVQVDSDLTRIAEGTGLGLAISRDLARGMGGDLSVESTVGAGSTFILTLPRAQTGVA
jgi:signal transduction histidine kinase/PAS domain-containing protein